MGDRRRSWAAWRLRCAWSGAKGAARGWGPCSLTNGPPTAFARGAGIITTHGLDHAGDTCRLGKSNGSETSTTLRQFAHFPLPKTSEAACLVRWDLLGIVQIQGSFSNVSWDVLFELSAPSGAVQAGEQWQQIAMMAKQSAVQMP